MKIYIGTKIIKAKPMTKKEFYQTHPNLPPPDLKNDDGYLVIYSNKYESWSPKNIFEQAYREIASGEMEIIDNYLSEENPEPEGQDKPKKCCP